MAAKKLDGKLIAQNRRNHLKAAIADSVTTHESPPGLAVVLVGEDPASQIYVSKKQAACQAVGIHSQCQTFPHNITTETLIDHIQKLNQDESIDGILVQLPLPPQIDAQQVLNTISPLKDVDGFHPTNMGKLILNQPGLRPCTPQGIMYLLEETDLTLAGAEACVVGASNIVGKPIATMLLNAEATVTQCHIKTQDLAAHLKRADLVIVAIGQPNFIQGSWLKPGAVVIDVGINRLANGTITGDVDAEQAAQVAGWLTPVPGGVGPMTVTALLENTFYAYCRLRSGEVGGE